MFFMPVWTPFFSDKSGSLSMYTMMSELTSSIKLLLVSLFLIVGMTFYEKSNLQKTTTEKNRLLNQNKMIEYDK